MKKLFTALITTSMLLCAAMTTVMADDFTESTSIEIPSKPGIVNYYTEPTSDPAETELDTDYNTSFTIEEAAEAFDAAIIAPNEVRYIDRITVSDIGLQFYNALVEGTDYDGVDDWLIPGNTRGKYQITSKHYSDGITPDNCVAMLNEAIRETITELAPVTYAFFMDHPEVFWLDDIYGLSSAGSPDADRNGFTVSLSIDILDSIYKTSYKGTSGRQAFENDMNRMKRVINDIMFIADSETTDRQIVYFNYWLCKNNDYNPVLLEGRQIDSIAYSSISALLNYSSLFGPVCEGYAKAFKVLCDTCGIPCVLTTSEDHMWNEVMLDDGKWYAVDVTWNDPVGAPEGYVGKEYLLVGSNTVDSKGQTFNQSHLLDNTYYDEYSKITTSFKNQPTIQTSRFYSDPTIETARLTLTDVIGTTIMIHNDFNGGKEKVIVTFLDGTSETYNLADCYNQNENYYLDIKLPVKNMNDTFKVEVRNHYGKTANTSYLSIAYIAYQQALNTENYALFNLANSIIDMGGAAQTYFNHNTEDLSTKYLYSTYVPKEPEKNATEYLVTGSVSGLEFDGISLVLKSSFGIRVYFNLTSGKISDYTFKWAGNTLTPIAKDGQYYVELTNIYAYNLARMNDITVTKGSQQMTVSCSVMSGVNMVTNHPEWFKPDFVALAKAIYNYYYYVNAYSATLPM